MRVVSSWLVVLLCACGEAGLPLVVEPQATVPAPVSTVAPPPGPFNGELTLTFTANRKATLFVSTDGSDPQATSRGRLEGPSPFTVTVSATATVRWFASAGGKDEAVQSGVWTRAGGPKGSIRGVVVVGDFAVAKKVGLQHNFEQRDLGAPAMPTSLPFYFENLPGGPHLLTAVSDQNGDGNAIPLVEYSSDTQTITLDLKDPFKASAENVTLYLGASAPELCTLTGTVTLPKTPAGQALQVAVLGAGGFTTDPQALLQQLTNGYRILTNNTDTTYRYVITKLMPGTVFPVAVLSGFGGGGLSLNLIGNPLRPVTLVAGKTSTQDFEFGPLNLVGNVLWTPATAPQGPAFAVVAARGLSLTNGIQAVLSPALLAPDAATQQLTGGFAAQALRSNASVSLRAFPGAGAMQTALTDALGWVVNPLSPLPPMATVQLGTSDATVDVRIP